MAAAEVPRIANVRCPAAGCGVVFPVPRERLGRNVYCIACGVRLTARPASVDDVLAERARLGRATGRVSSAADARLDRLPFRVVVDNVRSLWNVGSIFRTADGCGVAHVYLTGITGHPPRAEIDKTALGAQDVVAWSWHEGAHEAITAARHDGHRIVALEAGGRPLDEVVWDEPVCLVLGNEVAGVAPASLEAADQRVELPMLGLKTSFNVAVAFGIAAHRISRGLVKSIDGVAPTASRTPGEREQR